MNARTIRRVEALEAKTPTDDNGLPWILVGDRGEPDVEARIAALQEAGFNVIRLIGVKPAARPAGIDPPPPSVM